MKIFFYHLIWFVLVITITNSALAQNNNSDIYFYKKSESNTGVLYLGTEIRDQIRTNNSRDFEQLTTGSVQFQYKNQYWNFLDFKQEQFEFDIKAGPLWGNGNRVDSSSYQNIEANQNISGIRTNAGLGYSNRYYWDRKTFTIVDVGTWGLYDLYNRNSKGTKTDSSDINLPYNESDKVKKLRYGLKAKAGWGFGRLNPMNNYMLADHIVSTYPGRNFSKKEIVQIADEIGKIKQKRDRRNGHSNEKEALELQEFINKKLLLTVPVNLSTDWKFGEFLPRFSGNRIELGPFFRYYNREPDFIYGAYLTFKNAKYSGFSWNRNFSAELIYNSYKQNDWILTELDLGWSYFPNLKCQWDFGLKYVPAMYITEIKDIQPISHNFIPYFGYFTQVNSRLRIKANASLRISDDEEFMLAGPEFSLAVYWSKY